jgi:outer membrane protein OmpA-like peptidoglycan-associated protein
VKGVAKRIVLAAVIAQLAACSGLDRGHEEALNWAADIEVTQAPEGVSVRLSETVLFDTGRSNLRADAGPAIDRAVAILARTDKQVVVEGHTDKVGSHDSNQALSEARARAVAQALENDGIPASRITLRGYSYDRPIADNDTADGRAQNRRAEISIPGESADKLLGRATYAKGDEAFVGPIATPSEAQASHQQSTEQPPNANPHTTGTVAPTHFVWPAQGRVEAPFVAGKTRGMLIAGEPGEPVKAVADGRVVYAGTAVEAYGPLVIIQHRDGFVTAYAHNGRLLVKGNQTVVQGQSIAEMGASDQGGGMLQFEVRRNGQQLDPLNYLPASGG